MGFEKLNNARRFYSIFRIRLHLFLLKFLFYSRMRQLRTIIIVSLFLTGSVFSQEKAEKSENYKEEEVHFHNAQDTIYGKLILPKKSDVKFPVVVFVHGSGPEDYSSSNNYRYLWEKFTEAGYACFSWDRPGVGHSQGNWFEKSIDNRTAEVFDAVQKLKQHPKINPEKIGFWGISQAGWVIPKVAEVISPAFVISVSGPVTTAFDQEVYRLRSELAMDAYSTKSIDSAIAYTKAVRNLILEDKPFAAFDSVQLVAKQHSWSSYIISGGEEIYQYLSVILKDDHFPDLSVLNCPLLAIWGENDLLVPPHSSADQYKRVMEEIGNKKAKIIVLPNADHTLTYNHSGKRTETIERREKYKDEPEKIFAPGYLEVMISWLKELNLTAKSD
jgi:pimeloyl-ACP methyl ester carboxylesterase